MSADKVAVSTIPANDDPARRVEIHELLQALVPFQDDWQWQVRNLEWLGRGLENLCQAVERAGSEGVWLTSEELIQHTAQVQQTIEGEFVAFPKRMYKALNVPDRDSSCFPQSRAQLAFISVDGQWFDVYAKHGDHVAALEDFPRTQVQDPTLFFTGDSLTPFSRVGNR